MMCELTVNQIISAIAAPVLIVVLVLVLVVLVSKRNKTDTLASLAYELQNLIRACKKQDPDLKELKTLDSTGAKCALLCDRAVGQQNQDIGAVPDHIAAACKILSALSAAKTPAKECNKYLDLAVIQLESAYSFLINTLGITAAPPTASLKFFSSNMRSDNARKFLASLNVAEKPSQEEAPEADDEEE